MIGDRIKYQPSSARGYRVIFDGTDVGEVEQRLSSYGGGWRFRNQNGAYGDCATRHLATIALIEIHNRNL